jgi:hypothetical protein
MRIAAPINLSEEEQKNSSNCYIAEKHRYAFDHTRKAC